MVTFFSDSCAICIWGGRNQGVFDSKANRHALMAISGHHPTENLKMCSIRSTGWNPEAIGSRDPLDSAEPIAAHSFLLVSSSEPAALELSGTTGSIMDCNVHVYRMRWGNFAAGYGEANKEGQIPFGDCAAIHASPRCAWLLGSITTGKSPRPNALFYYGS